MDPKHIDGISLDGFQAPVTVAELHETGCSGVPQSSGIYLVIRADESLPNFLSQSTGGWFKKLDPTDPPEMVHGNWVPSAHVVYVGKAAGKGGLRRRIRDLIAFGSGNPRGHRGGRLLWNLPDSEKLVVRWRLCLTGADEAKTDLIARFKLIYEGKRPFANLTK